VKRIHFTLIAVVFLTSIATAQTPYKFTVAEVAVGSRHIKMLYLYASGKWSVAGPDIAATSTYIHCYEKLWICEDADAYSVGGKASASLTTYDIVHWDNREMIAVDSSPACVVNMLRVDFAAKKVSLSSNAKDTQDKACENLTLPPTAFLIGPE
jgi:hypothetical protein